MPRGKFVNHKGRSRHFTAPEELERELEESESSEDSDVEADGATGGKPKTKKTGSANEDDDSDEESEEEDRDCKKGVAGLIEIENPNRAVKKTKKKLENLSIANEIPELTRKEREHLEEQKARARYEKLHAAGKTIEAKADLARLALIRQQREEAAAKREAEKKALEGKKAATK